MRRIPRFVARRWTLALTFMLHNSAGAGVSVVGTAPAAAVGHSSGHTPWAIVLGKFPDPTIAPLTNGEPYPMDWLSRYFTEAGKGQGGIFHYWA